MRGSFMSMTDKLHSSNFGRRFAVVIAAIGAESAIMNWIRASGSAGSIGIYAAPVFRTAMIDTIASADRGNSSATDCPGAAPWLSKKCANRFAAESNWKYVKE